LGRALLQPPANLRRATSFASFFSRGDAENAMNCWANGLDQRLVTLGAGKQPSPTAAAN
jgi:hypothetical protein